MRFSRPVDSRSIRAVLGVVLFLSALAPSPVWAIADADEDPYGPVVLTGAVNANRVDRELFGLHININPTEAARWPSLIPATARLDTYWVNVERSEGIYNWAVTDTRVAAAEGSGAKPLLDVFGTPRFHALDSGPGFFASPPRLAAYARFVRAMVSRYGTRVDYQVWNEPNVPIFYTGTPEHMARMTKRFAKIARSLAPGATVVAPSFPLRVSSNQEWFKAYWRQRLGKKRVAQFVDVASLSAYPLPEGDPEDSLKITQWAKKTVERYGFSGPMWATEINYGANGGSPTKEIPMLREVSNVVRTFVLHASLGADRVYWWMWDPAVTVNTELQDGEGALTPAGIAFETVRDWLVDTRPTGCLTKRGVTTCGFRVNPHLERHIAWNRWGRTRTMLAPPGTRSRTDARGRDTRVKPGERLRVSLSPIMLEVRRARAAAEQPQ